MSEKGFINVDLEFDLGGLPEGVSVERVMLLLNERGNNGDWTLMLGNLLHMEGDAGWLDDESYDLRNDLMMLYDVLGIENSCWTLNVNYQSFEESWESGAIVNYKVQDGNICSWQQSVVVMEDATPWFSFDMTHGDTKMIPAKRYADEVERPLMEVMEPTLRRFYNRLCRKYGFVPADADKFGELFLSSGVGNACLGMMEEAGLNVKPSESEY